MSDWNDSSSHNREGFSLPWWVILVAFFVFPPAGVLMFIYNLNQKSQPSRRQQEWQRRQKEWFDAMNRVEQTDPDQKREPSSSTAKAQKNKTSEFRTTKTTKHRTRRKKIRDGKTLTIVGGICAAVFGFAAIDEFLFYIPNFSWYALQEVFVPLLFSCASLGVAAWGWYKTRQARRFRKLLNLIGDQKLVDIHAVADAFPCKYEKACEMLQDMAYMGYLGQRAYVDSASGQLVLTGEGVRARRKAEQKAAEKAKKTQEEGKEEKELSILQEIREVNDAIPDPVLSRKISRIEEITGHILEYQKKHPEKAGELHTFLNYYLPTTLKILNAYAELERQGVEGENISATKDRIERMMDMVVEGFENQLDKLFRDDMLDITSDISVMEKMMGRDGLAGDMQMPKVKEEPAEPKPSEGIHLTLDPEGEQEPSSSQSATGWESGFYRKTKEELKEQ